MLLICADLRDTNKYHNNSLMVSLTIKITLKNNLTLDQCNKDHNLTSIMITYAIIVTMFS